MREAALLNFLEKRDAHFFLVLVNYINIIIWRINQIVLLKTIILFLLLVLKL